MATIMNTENRVKDHALIVAKVKASVVTEDLGSWTLGNPLLRVRLN